MPEILRWIKVTVDQSPLNCKPELDGMVPAAGNLPRTLFRGALPAPR